MPFRERLEFDLQTRQVMTAAYDAAFAKLGIESSDLLTSRLAAAIVNLAQNGMTDQFKLCDSALAKLKQ